MNLERMNAGEYVIRDGEREVKLTKGLNRKWTVTPGEGLPAAIRTVASYSAAKIVGEGMLRKGGEDAPKPDTPVVRKARAALAKADPDTLRLTLSDRLHKMADELLN